MREKAIARALIGATNEILQAAYAEEGRGDELQERAEGLIFELGNQRDLGKARSVATLLHEAFDEMQNQGGRRERGAHGLLPVRRHDLGPASPAS